MNIAFYVPSLPEPGRKVGGVEVAVHRLANALAQNPSTAVTVYTLTDNRPSDAIYAVQVLFFKYRRLWRHRLARLFFAPILLNFVSFTKHQVLHLHGDDWFYVRRTIPTVRTLNGSAKREAAFAESFKRKLLLYLIHPLERLSVRLCTRPLALGSDTARLFGISEVTYYGVDRRVFLPGPKAKLPTVFFLGTWRGRKRGHFLFQQFLEVVLPRVPDGKLIMACPPEEVPPHPNVLAVGYPSDQEIAEYFRESWVFAYPSTYEGFGIAYIEALCSGTAILTSPNPGAFDILGAGLFGTFAEDKDFGQELAALLSRESKRKHFERQGLSRAADFSWEAVADFHLRQYQEAANRFQVNRKK